MWCHWYHCSWLLLMSALVLKRSRGASFATCVRWIPLNAVPADLLASSLAANPHATFTFSSRGRIQTDAYDWTQWINFKLQSYNVLYSLGSRISYREGFNLRVWCANLLFTKVLPKTEWKWKNLGGGRASLVPLDPPLLYLVHREHSKWFCLVPRPLGPRHDRPWSRHLVRETQAPSSTSQPACS